MKRAKDHHGFIVSKKIRPRFSLGVLEKRVSLDLDKRQKIIVSSVVMSLALISFQLVPFYLTYRFIFGLAAFSYFLSLWSLWEGISKLRAVVLMILPTLFTLAVASYYFLLPVRWLTRIPVASAFGLAFYFLLLMQNVFNVASVRTIPLYRVASIALFVYTLFTCSLLFNVVFSFHLLFVLNGLIVFLLTLPLVLQVIWSIEMENITGLIIVYSLMLSLVMGEVALALSFWPISNAMISVVLTATLYIILGISSDALRSRLTREVVWGFLRWGIIIFLIAAVTTSWTG